MYPKKKTSSCPKCTTVMCFHIELKHGLLHVKEISIQKFNNLIQWRFHLFQFTIMFLDDTYMQRNIKFCIYLHPKLRIHTMFRASINFESTRCCFNFVTSILATTTHWHSLVTIFAHRLIYPNNCIKNVSLIGMTNNMKK
jgi:hypothetical protein